MIVKYVLILVLSGDEYRTSPETWSYEFGNLQQCQYVHKVLTDQVKKTRDIRVIGGGCFEK